MQLMSHLIRPFHKSDYPAIVEIGNRLYPEYPSTEESQRFMDDSRGTKEKFARFVVEKAASVIAYGQYFQHSHTFHPQIFDLQIDVDPDHVGRGIRRELYEILLSEIRQFDPKKLRSFTRVDFDRAVEFYKSLGFVETMRAWESRLDVASFNFSSYEGHIEKVEENGIKLVPLSEIPRSEERDRALHELDNELGADVPSLDPFTPLDYEHFLQRVIDRPELFPEAFWIALDGDRYVGSSTLWKSMASDHLYTGLTGVRRDYRRRGIALALKLKTLEIAKKAGCPTVRTWNESNNRAMLSINEAMGFKKQPAWINFAKELRD